MSEQVVLLGASSKPERNAHRAFRMLREHGHTVLPVHPALAEIDGVPVSKNLTSVSGPVDTLTLYVNPAISEPLADQIVAMRPRRVIFNPGTESPLLQARLDQVGIAWTEECTLVMLSLGTF